MEHITLGEISLSITCIVGIISGLGFLHKHLKKWMSALLHDEFSKMDEMICDLKDKVDRVDLESSKNFLVARLTEIEHGDEPPDDIVLERFWEVYEGYAAKGGNSYIKRKIQQLEQDGKL